MRPTRYVCTAIIAAALVLSGCAHSAQPSATASASAIPSADAAPQMVDCANIQIDSASDALPSLTGDAGAQPTISWTGKDAPANLTVSTLEAGKGQEIGNGDYVTVNYSGWMWNSDTPFDSSFTRGQTSGFSLNEVIEGWRCGLPGHHEGDRLLMSIPANLAYGEQSSNGISGPLVFVVEVAKATQLSSLSGASAGAVMEGEQELADRGVNVVGDVGQAPQISVAEGTIAPTQVETIVLARGSGEPVTADSTLALNLAYTTWDNAYKESTWDEGSPTVMPMNGAPGLAGLEGLPVGSRVVVLLPAAGQGQNKDGTPALSEAYVIDIEAIL